MKEFGKATFWISVALLTIAVVVDGKTLTWFESLIVLLYWLSGIFAGNSITIDVYEYLRKRG